MEKKLEKVTKAMQEYQTYSHRLLEVSFTTVQDYLSGLETLAEVTKTVPSVVFYLPAAVSDFYLPEDKLAEHKIQSRDVENLTVELVPVPKKLGVIKLINPNAFAISYKLETDVEILESKALMSLEKYGMDMVIANLL